MNGHVGVIRGVGLVMLCALTLTAGSASASRPRTASCHPTARTVVACVGAQPITRATFRHWAAVAGTSEGATPEPKSEILSQVMSFLVSSDWLIGEARTLGIRVSPAAVQRRFEKIRHAQFPKAAKFKAFLRSSGQTVADLHFRTRVEMLSTRIQNHAAGHHTGSSRSQALSRFVERFQRKWKARTSCAPAYRVADCGHVLHTSS
jgi:hypothetical protein